MAMQPPVPPGVPGPPPGAPGSPQMMGGPTGARMMPPGMKPPVPGQMGAPGQMPVPGQPGQPGQDEQPLGPQIGFFQQPWVQNVLPLVTSLVAHAMIIIIASVFVTVVIAESKKVVQEEQTIIPESTMAENAPPGGVPNVGTGGDPFKQAMQDQAPDAGTPEGWANKQSPNVDPAAAGGGSGDNADSGLIGVGMGGLGKGGGFGTGSGNGAGGGNGDGGGPMAMFGTPGGGGIGPKGPVFGHGGNARKIVFICDATGTMINKLGILKQELSRTIQDLRVSQSFNVIFYTDGGKVFIANPDGLMIANADNKRKTATFLDDVTPTGTTDPIPAIQTAFKQNAQLIYFLSDGEFNNLKSYDQVQAEFKKNNPGTKVKVNTILFETYDAEAEKVMEQIAKENGGRYSYVKEADLR